MKKSNGIFYKTDLDNLQTTLEGIQKSNARFVITSKEEGKPTLSLFETVIIQRIDDKYLILNLYYEKTEHSISKQLEFICAEEGEDIDIDNIFMSDIEIWSLSSFGVGEKIYPLE